MLAFKQTILAVLIFFAATAVVALAATTIGTSINTDGSLTVTGTSTFSGLVIAEQAIQGGTGSDLQRILLEDGDGHMTLYGLGENAPTIVIGEEDISVFSPDTGSDVTVRDSFVSLSSESATLSIDGDDGTITLSGDAEVTLSADTIRASSPFAFPSGENVPACNTTIAPSGYAAFAVDTTGPDLCMCDGNTWTPVDGSGTCTVEQMDDV